MIMGTITMPEKIDRQRRRLFETAAMTIAAAQFGAIRSADSQPGKTKLPAIKPGMHNSLGPLKQIDAGALNVGYAEAGPADGPAVILPHGWPYDIYSFVDVAPLLASASYPSRICAAMARRDFFQVKRPATASSRWSLSMPSP
jgi:hypothetical protein